ncbi:class I SAM-dependent methyltransferase [uncultured Sphingomonas sp.]|uniref:class I SAM-dependent methyltransferase n=1 Tax=uncultured Sphingomonas sp. TaxID=158754 RepID=UPI0035C98FDC
MPVSREEALWAYRLILGREPEDEGVLHRTGAASIGDLRRQFLTSQEFIEQWPYAVIGAHLNEAVDHVDPSATSEQLALMLDRIAAAWNALGTDDPYWSMLTDDRYRKQSIDSSVDEFYNSGTGDVERVIATLRRNGIDPTDIRRVTDFGCGVGRLSLALAKRFPEVTGVDVSEPHVAIAREQATKHNIGNATFRSIKTVDALTTLPECDLLVTLIVLQHNPPPLMVATLRHLLGRVAPGGIAVFQIPTYLAGYGFDAATYLANDQPQMEMNALPQRHIFALAKRLGLDVLEVREDLSGGSQRIVSQTFLLQRPA